MELVKSAVFLSFLIVYFIVGITYAIQYRSKKKYFVDRFGDNIFLVLFWGPLLIFAVIEHVFLKVKDKLFN